MSCETPEPSLWDEELTITRGELGTMLDALQMLGQELKLLEGEGYQPAAWLQELHAKAIKIARTKRDAP